MILVQRNMRLQSLVPPSPLFRGIQCLGLGTESRGRPTRRRLITFAKNFYIYFSPTLSHRNSPHYQHFHICPFSDRTEQDKCELRLKMGIRCCRAAPNLVPQTAYHGLRYEDASKCNVSGTFVCQLAKLDCFYFDILQQLSLR